MGMVKEVAAKISKLIAAVSLVFAVVAGLAVAAIAIAVVVEVIARDLFNHPILDIVTIGRMGMGVVGLLGAAYALRVRKHVCVDLIIDHLPGRTGKILNVAGMTVCFVCLVLLIWGTFSVARFSQLHRIRFEGLYTFPVYLPQMLVPLGLGLFALEVLDLIVRQIYRMAEGPPANRS